MLLKVRPQSSNSSLALRKHSCDAVSTPFVHHLFYILALCVLSLYNLKHSLRVHVCKCMYTCERPRCVRLPLTHLRGQYTGSESLRRRGLTTCTSTLNGRQPAHTLPLASPLTSIWSKQSHSYSLKKYPNGIKNQCAYILSIQWILLSTPNGYLAL